MLSCNATAIVTHFHFPFHAKYHVAIFPQSPADTALFHRTGPEILKGMSDEAVRKLAIQFLSGGKKPVNGIVKLNTKTFSVPHPLKGPVKKKGRFGPAQRSALG